MLLYWSDVVVVPIAAAAAAAGPVVHVRLDGALRIDLWSNNMYCYHELMCAVLYSSNVACITL